MKITENFKQAVKKAKEAGYTDVLVTRTSNFGTNAVVLCPIDELLISQIGIHYPIPALGKFMTKQWLNEHLENNWIQYQTLMSIYG